MIIGFDQSNEARLAWEKAELNYSTVGLIQFASEYSAACLTRRGAVWYGVAFDLLLSSGKLDPRQRPLGNDM